MRQNFQQEREGIIKQQKEAIQKFEDLIRQAKEEHASQVQKMKTEHQFEIDNLDKTSAARI